MTEETARERLIPLLDRLYALLKQIDRNEGHVGYTKPYPPAAEEDIVKAEARLDFRFPGSYRAFLKLHNGWKNIRYSWSILGVSGPGYAQAEKQWKNDVQMFEKAFRKDGPRHADGLREKEKEDPEVIYMPHHPPLATDFNGEYLVFDRNRPGKGGEFEIAWVTNGEFVDFRYKDLIEYTEQNVSQARGELRDNGVDPDAVEAAAGVGKTKKKSSSAKRTTGARKKAT